MRRSLLYIFCFLPIFLFSQTIDKDFLVINSDTVYYNSVKIDFGKHNMNFICQTLNDKDLVIESKNTNRVSAYKINNRIFEFIDASHLYKKRGTNYFWKKIDGEIKLYTFFSEDPSYTNNDYPNARNSRLIKLPNGKLIRIHRNKDVRNKLKPILIQCAQFTKKYEGEFNKIDLEKLIKLYNHFCNQ